MAEFDVGGADCTVETVYVYGNLLIRSVQAILLLVIAGPFLGRLSANHLLLPLFQVQERASGVAKFRPDQLRACTQCASTDRLPR